MRPPALRLPAGMVFAAPLLCLASLAFAAPAPSSQDAGWSESGEASWYGPRHEGQRTTSGERFDSSKMTAAHPSLPMGAYVRVTVQDSGRSIVVRVNDREPPHGVRCIDLSRAAAQRLGIVGRGVADVILAQVSAPEAVELAEAPADALPIEARPTAPHGRRHTHHAHR